VSARARALLLVVVTLMLCSCAVFTPRELPQTSADELWQQRAQRLQELSDWSFNGRAAVDGRNFPSRTVRVTWSAVGASYRMSFMTPFGQQLAELAGDTDVASLRVPNEETRSAASPEALLYETLGWSVPLRALCYWVRGLPAPDSMSDSTPDLATRSGTQLDAKGRLVAVMQDGWEVKIDRYAEVAGLELPRRLTVSREGLRIRLLIDEWRLEL
jgi:outer membrane lipoprotein LolB